LNQLGALISLVQLKRLSSFHDVMDGAHNPHELSHSLPSFDHHKREVLTSLWALQDKCYEKESGLSFLNSNSYHKAMKIRLLRSSEWLYSQTLLHRWQHFLTHWKSSHRKVYSCSSNKTAIVLSFHLWSYSVKKENSHWVLPSTSFNISFLFFETVRASVMCVIIWKLKLSWRRFHIKKKQFFVREGGDNLISNMNQLWK